MEIVPNVVNYAQQVYKKHDLELAAEWRATVSWSHVFTSSRLGCLLLPFGFIFVVFI